MLKVTWVSVHCIFYRCILQFESSSFSTVSWVQLYEKKMIMNEHREINLFIWSFILKVPFICNGCFCLNCCFLSKILITLRLAENGPKNATTCWTFFKEKDLSKGRGKWVLGSWSFFLSLKFTQFIPFV